jgi:hypothetical protein
MAGDEFSIVGAALRTINQASYHVLASFALELYEANHVISEALLSKHQSRHLNTDEPQGKIAAESESIITTSNDKPSQDQRWPYRPETALGNLVEYWLYKKAMNSEHDGACSGLPLTLRKAIISNSPAVVALLRKFCMKRKRLAQYK